MLSTVIFFSAQYSKRYHKGSCMDHLGLSPSRCTKKRFLAPESYEVHPRPVYMEVPPGVLYPGERSIFSVFLLSLFLIFFKVLDYVVRKG